MDWNGCLSTMQDNLCDSRKNAQRSKKIRLRWQPLCMLCKQVATQELILKSSESGAILWAMPLISLRSALPFAVFRKGGTVVTPFLSPASLSTQVL